MFSQQQKKNQLRNHEHYHGDDGKCHREEEEEEQILLSQVALSHAIELNNQASKEMSCENGNLVLACQLLASALKSIKSFVKECYNDGRYSTKQGSRSSYSCRFVDDDTESTAIPEESESRFLFSHPIHVDNQNEGLDLDNHDDDNDGDSSVLLSEDLIETLPYVVIYNLALCSHLRAVSITSSTGSSDTTARQQELLRQATALYSHAQKLLMNNSHHGSRSAPDHHPLYSLALANNLGHAHDLLQNETSAKQYFEHLLHAIMTMFHAQQQSNSKVQRKNLDGFLSNIMAVEMLGSTSCAPAA